MRKLVYSCCACLFLAGCAATDPIDVVKETAAFVVVGATQDEYVQACQTRGNSSLECHAEYNQTRQSHRAYYDAQKKREEAADDLSDDLDAYFDAVEDDPRPD